MLPAEIKILPEEIIIIADQFYGLVDNLYWYFKQTEDMGVTIEDKLSIALKDLTAAYDKLSLYLKASIRGEK